MSAPSSLALLSPVHFTAPPPGPTILLVSPDPTLVLAMHRIFTALRLCLETVFDVETGLAIMGGLPSPSVILLDGRLPGIANGRILATMQAAGIHGRFPVALIADQVCDEWIARLRQGVIDDIVPRAADATTWSTHLNTMQRGHDLHKELQQLRETALLELEHDRATGVFNREAMLSILFRETDRVQRLRGCLCLLLLEVDDLNDWRNELGWKACDKLLADVAARTSRVLRSYDVLGRVARDQFLLVLPGCSTVHAVMLAERMRIEVFGEPFEMTNIEGAAARIQLTARFAIAPSRGRSAVVVLREAEQTLEQTKSGDTGINRTAGGGQLAANAADCGLFPDSAERDLAQNGPLLV